MRVLAVIGIVLAVAAISAFAGDLADGMKFFESKDYARAISSFRNAATQGEADAQSMLGVMYLQGQGVTQDYKQAAFWFEKAAMQGDASAQHDLGFMYEEGQGVAKDYKQAAYWYEKSAAQGSVIAKFMLYSLYSEGVAKNNVEAHKWATIAAANGMPFLGRMREMLEMEMTMEQIAEAQRRASEWMKAHK